MSQKSLGGRGNRRTARADADAGAEGGVVNDTLPAEVEARLRDEFESLIQRMQTHQSAEAYDALAKMTGEEVRDFFRATRARETASTLSPEATESGDMGFDLISQPDKPLR